ncbi:AAA family ATPase [Halosquirtibacter laminarini]|uniref:AAA family ATPase n=1 Tax=Halosquirtibacter laminarini TaxID=3374600 RepID=A0AC61NL61_9BACT|nr:AAA family ATPase [Prolixibacteraceae bacterium]
MRIINITIENIHSLKGKHSIDFDQKPLSDTGIFAIIGPTGSGKSTILDAICLALYNQTPRTGRLSKSAIDLFGSIMTKNAKNALAEVTYQVKGTTYRSKWMISHTRTGNLRDYEMELSEIQENGSVIISEKRSTVPSENSRIIGLSFDQFNRSMMLSQGAFTKFIEAGPNERGELLEKITGTEVFRKIGIETFDRHKAESLNLEKKRQELEKLNILSPEELKVYTEEKKSHEGLLEKKREVLKGYQDQQNLHRQKEDALTLQKGLQEKTLKLNDQVAAFEESRQMITAHNRVQPHIIEIHQLHQDKDHIDKLSKESANQQKEENEKKELLQGVSKHLEEATICYKETVENEKKMTPIWTKVTEFDQDIKVAKESLITLHTQQKSQEEGYRKREQKVETIQKDILKAKEKKEVLLQKRKESKQVEELQQKIFLVESLETQLTNDNQEIQSYYKKEGESKTVLALQSEKTITGKLTVLHSSQQKAHDYVETLEKQLQGHTFETINLKKEQIQKEIDALLKYTDYRKQTETLVKAIEEDKKLVKASELHCTQLEIETEKIRQQLEIEKLRLEELEKRREREVLESNYEVVRDSLTPESPCPLCGSLSHPYVQEMPQNKLDETTRSISETKQRIVKASEDQTKLVHTLTKERTSATLKNQNITDSQRQIASIKEEIQHIHLSQPWQLLDSQESNTKIKSMKGSLEKLNQLHVSLNNLHKIRDRKKTIDDLVTKFNQVNKTLIQLESILQVSLDSQLERVGIAVKKAKERVAEHEQLHREIETLQTMLQNLITREETEIKELNLAKIQTEEGGKRFAIHKEKYDKMVLERESLFQKRDPQKERLESEQKKESSREKLSLLEKQEVQVKADIQRVSIRVKEILQDKVEIEKQYQEREKQLLQRAKTLGYTAIEEMKRVILEPSQYDTLVQRESLLVKEQVTLTESTRSCKEQLVRIEKQIDSSKSLQELLMLDKTLQQEINEKTKELGIIENKLTENNRASIHSKVLLEDIGNQERETNKWRNLVELIGDANGNKFAKYAQELTLRKLLFHANRHMKNLSDRYWIEYQRNDKVDDLFIVDTYHGDVTRAVKTLSGGEKFIVSLSLAIGLSELAGKKTQVESLFIDEGFGTLDQEALDIAITALERLQMEQNRTIGVISHVKEIKERITTQISLQKKSNGYSTLKINS